MALGTLGVMSDDDHPPSTAPPAPDDEPDFGPSGYLPQRAARRARKIVLRAPMGMHWIWGSVAVGVGVLVVGLVFLSTAGGPPGPPFEELGPPSSFDSGVTVIDDAKYLVSADAGRLRIFEFPAPGVTWCEASRRFEGDAGVWSPTGRGLGGVESMRAHPTVIVEGILYWDPTTLEPAAVPDATPVERAC